MARGPRRGPHTGDAFIADCPARLAFDLFAHTWTSVVVYALRDGPRRPAELRAVIGGISAKALTETLHRLEDSGLVLRRAYAEAPPRVDYELTAAGRSLLDPILALGAWTDEYGDDVLRARDRAEDRRAAAHPAGRRAAR
ncbi:winged helix-turn-helix transcriptional regulator [Nocardiopsis trehalosi]|jgi:DNA-binding HxlR family transcriptional regulator|uniref:winged helix-turn-helix transcriptional regulator n=1 Tax=Nocardiopsis trehalosi TaxID=109329 RepID=UPI0008309BBB|nr:helix-turn-helix domain-containing protein [Nocardiopsis trehalosi]